MNFSTLKLALYNWASAQSGIPTVWAYQNSPQPSHPYITLYLASLVQVGTDGIFSPNNMGISRLIGQREFTLNIGCYGNAPFYYLERLANSLSKPSVNNSLMTNGIIYVRTLSINDITDLEETQWKPRANMDVQFRIADEYFDDVGLIEHVEITEKYYDVDQLVYTITNTIPPISP